MKRSILSTTSERIVNTFTKEEMESFAAMDIDAFINWVETQNDDVSPVMILYFKTIHKMCVDAMSNDEPSTDS